MRQPLWNLATDGQGRSGLGPSSAYIQRRDCILAWSVILSVHSADPIAEVKLLIPFCADLLIMKSITGFLKGHGNEADFLWFLHKLVPQRSLTLPFEPFRFWLRIRGDIRPFRQFFWCNNFYMINNYFTLNQNNLNLRAIGSKPEPR